MPYDLNAVKAPRATGAALRALAFLLENPVTGPLLAKELLKNVDVAAIRVPTQDVLPLSHGVFQPIDPTAPAAPVRTEPPAPAPAVGDFRFETAHDFTEAYRAGRLSPLDVAERVLAHTAAFEAHTPPMRIFIAQDADDLRAQARASAERWRRGAPLGPLDGVPVAVKDEIPQVPYPTTCGTGLKGLPAATGDAALITRLREAGALLIGKTNMHEVGLGTTGVNPHHGTARNPYDPSRFTGGSSSGSGAVVAAGLAPIAIGCDGGGSIRIPAALCGVVGLKPTFGRVSASGAFPNCWSVDHHGPIGASVRDVAIAYMQIAGRDPADPHTAFQPAPTLHGIDDGHLRGVRLGVFAAWFDDADPEVVAACRAVLGRLEAAGAELVPVDIPELGLMSTIHSITIVSEMYAAARADLEREPGAFCLESRINFALMKHLRPEDYLQAQRHRGRVCRQFASVLDTVDAVVTPTTACTARALSADVLAHGASDINLVTRLMRFTQPANLTGLPAVSFPAGYDADGLPIGFQAIGRAWDEALLLRLAAVAERTQPTRRPRVHAALLTQPAAQEAPCVS